VSEARRPFEGRRRWGTDVALVVLVLAAVVPLLHPHGVQQVSRMALTAAIWDDGSVRIDGYPLGPDRAERDGHTYSDKAPGQPILSVPVYAAYRALGGEPARHRRVDGNLGLWVATVWSGAIPLALLAVAVRRAASRIDPGVALPVALATVFSTLLLPLSSVLFGHVLGALLAFLGWSLASTERPSHRRLAASGAALGLAVLVEYTLVLPAVAILAHVAWQQRRQAFAFVAGAMPFALALVGYQWVAFGSPFAFSYASSTFTVGGEPLDPPLLLNTARVLVGERGLLLVTPIIALGAIGTVLLIRRSSGYLRSAYLAAAASAVSVVGVQAFWSNPTGGDSPGARYATASAAFLAPGLTVAWRRWPRICLAAATFGAIMMLAATWTNPLEARNSPSAVRAWLDHLAAGRWAPTVGMPAGGWGSGAVLFIVAGAAIIAARRLVAGTDGAPERDPPPSV
jgi:hypothetical protein